MNNDAQPSVFQSILLDTDGTVTDLIGHIVGEQIHITKLSQEIVTADEPEPLELPAPTQLLHRTILLSGAAQHFLFAESFFVIERMSDYLRRELLESQVPIGLLWQQEKLETFREILQQGRENCAALREYFPDINSDQFFTRSYRVFHHGAPLGVITEKFPVEYFVTGQAV